MSIAALNSTATASTASTESSRITQAGDSVATTVAHAAEAVADGVSATVSFSGQALQKLLARPTVATTRRAAAKR